jgi:predicted nucleic acid-binding Zn ribbon protein
MNPSRNDTVTATCPRCGGPLPVGRSRRWCSDACRQAAWRRRHQPVDPAVAVPPARPKRTSTVYQCPDCETRLLGTQRCEDCGIFMRRLGTGGHCSACDEPITINELLNS